MKDIQLPEDSFRLSDFLDILLEYAKVNDALGYTAKDMCGLDVSETWDDVKIVKESLQNKFDKGCPIYLAFAVWADSSHTLCADGKEYQTRPNEEEEDPGHERYMVSDGSMAGFSITRRKHFIVVSLGALCDNDGQFSWVKCGCGVLNEPMHKFTNKFSDKGKGNRGHED